MDRRHPSGSSNVILLKVGSHILDLENKREKKSRIVSCFVLVVFCSRWPVVLVVEVEAEAQRRIQYQVE